ncbi:MAG: D-tyrosyl-tRNA(Tyr) deacylase [Deltaproteobacteria bacterium]|nr:D-tyrosyl-tRNA(Tyr) deacylase [Deltaproteobacteria bacterium]
MRAVVQRVSRARVTVDERPVSSIGPGLLVLLGVASSDTIAEADWLLDKVLDLRIFENESGKFDRSLRDVGGELMVVSQFTLLADTRRGRRPSFTDAAAPSAASLLYEHVVARASALGVRAATGEFGAHMAVELVNDGPVTVLLDSNSR